MRQVARQTTQGMYTHCSLLDDTDFGISPQPTPSRNESHGEVNTTYLVWDSRIVDADGDPADTVM